MDRNLMCVNALYYTAFCIIIMIITRMKICKVVRQIFRGKHKKHGNKQGKECHNVIDMHASTFSVYRPIFNNANHFMTYSLIFTTERN